MTKFLKILKTLQESLLRNSSSKTFQQPKKCSSFSLEGNPFLKRQKYPRTQWCLGSHLERSFLLKIPLTLTIAKGFSSRYMIPPKMILKTASKKTSEVDRLTIIPAWMKKTKIKRFQDSLGNGKNKDQNISKNKNLHGFNVSGPKFKMTNLTNKKSKTIQLMTESLKPRKFYKTVLSKITIPLFETKHLVLKKKNSKKGLFECQSGLEDSMKEVINANYKLTMSRCNNSDHNTNKQAGEPLVTIENNTEKSLVIVSNNKPKQLNKNDDRSRIRRFKAKNVIAEKDEKLLKLKAKHFEKPEVDLFIKKLAAKYGKTTVQKSARPRRIYENNRQTVKYDLANDKHLINVEKVGLITSHGTKKIETSMLHNSKKKLNEFIKKDSENNRVLKKGNNLHAKQKITSHKIDGKPKRGAILRKENLKEDKKLQTEAQFVNKKANSTIKLNSKNGFLKDRNKRVMPTTINTTNSEDNKFQTEIISSNNGDYELSKTVKKLTGSEKTDVKTQVLPNNQCMNINQPIISDTASNKINEFPTKTENMAGDSKYKHTKDQSIETMGDQTTEPLQKKTKDNDKHIAPNASASSKLADQMKYMKYTPDSPNYICSPKRKVASCKYKMSRGVHSDKPDISRESKRHLRKAQPDFKINNKISLNHRSDNSKITNKEATVIDINKNLPSKVEFGKIMDKTLSVPMKIYKFHCHSESLDYKVYKYDSSPSIYLATKPSNNIISNIDNVKTGNLEQLENLKKGEYQCFDSHKKQMDVKNEKLTNVNTVRVRFPPMVNFKINELTNKKEGTLITAKQPENSSFIPTKRENLPSILYRVLDTEKQTFASEKQSKPDSEEPKQMKGINVIHLEKVIDERNHIGEESNNININNLLLSNILISDKEKSNCSDIKNINLKNQIKDINLRSNYGTEEKSVNKTFLQQVSKEIYKTEEYNIDYSSRELKKILPFLKNLSNKSIDICSKEDTNLKSTENATGPEEKEKEFIMGKETSVKGNSHYDSSLEILKDKKWKSLISGIKKKLGLNNKNYNPNIFSTTCSEEQTKKNYLKSSAIENPKFEIQRNKEIEEMKIGNHIKSKYPSSHNQGGRTRDSKMWKSNIKINSLDPTFGNKSKTGINVLYYESTIYKLKNKEIIEVQYPTIITELQTKQHAIQPDQKSKSSMGTFEELVINKHVLKEKMKGHVFLKHNFNKEPFLKVFEDIHHVTSGMNIFSRHIPMFAINTNATEDKHSKKGINELLVLENDLKTMLFQQLDLYTREIKHKCPETIKQNENLKIYDLLDSTFILQCFNKTSLNSESSKNLVEVNFCKSSTSMNDFEFNNGTTENVYDKRIPMQVETNKDVSNTIKQIKTCGRIIVKQSPKDISIFEVLDCRIPMKYVKSTVKETSDDIGSQMFSIINPKHMCFYSKYRMNCMGQNVNMNHNNAAANQKPERKNTRMVIKTNIKQGSMTSNKIHNSESIPKSSNQEIPINMKMATFQEIYKYNQRKNSGNEDKNKVNGLSELELRTKGNSENVSLSNLKQEEKNTDPYARTASEFNICHSFPVKENPKGVKIEPEVLHYMKKIDKSSSNNGIPKLSNGTIILDKNSNEAIFKSEKIQERSYCSNESNKHPSNEIKNVSNHNKDEEIKSENLFLREISYSTDIKFLEKNNEDLSNVINECRKGTFEYLTKVVKKHKSDAQNMSYLASSTDCNKLKTSDEVFSSKNHKYLDNVKISSTKLSKLDPSNKDISTVSLNKNMKDKNKSGINSKENEVISSELVENSINKLKVMQNVKEQEKQLFRLRNLEKTQAQTKIEESDIFIDTNQIARSNKKVKSKNMLKIADTLIQNKLMSSVNKEIMNKKSPNDNINHDHKNKTETGSKIGLTTVMDNVKSAENSLKSICTEMKDFKKSNNITKTISTNIQNYNNSIRSRKKKHLDSDNTSNSNNSSKAVCKFQSGLNKKYESRMQKDINKEMQSNLLTRDEGNNFTKNLNFRSRHLDKISEKDIINEITLEEQKEGEKMNSEITKPIPTDYKNSDQITNMNTKVDMNVVEGNQLVKYDPNDIKTITNDKINIGNANESYITESIPTGFRCIRQLKIETDKDKGMEKYYLKNSNYAAESIKLRDNKRKRIVSPLNKEIGKSVISVKPTLTTDCGTTNNLNHYLLKHKKQLETITNDKRVKSIKNKLSSNLKTKAENKIMGKQPHSVKKKSDDDKKDPKNGFHSQKRGINKTIFTPESKEIGSARNKIGMAPETGNFSDRNYFLNGKDNPIQMPIEAKKPSLSNILSSESNFRQINEHKEDVFSKAENKEVNCNQQETNVIKKKKKETNNIGLMLPHYCSEKNINTYKESKYRDNPIYILKAQPKVEGFISQTLRLSNSQRSTSSKMFTGVVKKRQAGHLVKHRIKSELKQSAASLKKNISKHRLLKTDPRFKNDRQKDQCNLKQDQSSKMFSQKELPLHNFQKEQEKTTKNYLLDTPSRKVCGLTPPKPTAKEKPLVSTTKVTTKLIACTQQKENVHKQNFKIEKNVKNYGEDGVFFISRIHSMKPEKEQTTFKELYQMNKEDSSAQNKSEEQFDKSEERLLTDESKDQNRNLVEPKNSISDIQQNKPDTGLTIKVPDGNDLSNYTLISSSKSDIGLPAIVGNVVNNVKTRIQNFLLADIAKSKLNRGILSEKKRHEEIDDLKEKSSIANIPKHICREKNRIARLNQSTKQILCCPISSYVNGTNKQVQPTKKVDKTKRKYKNRGAGHRRKTISDLLGFNPVRNKQTCPQMSYSEVLNKFYAGCGT